MWADGDCGGGTNALDALEFCERVTCFLNFGPKELELPAIAQWLNLDKVVRKGKLCSVGSSCLDHLARKSLVELQRQLQNHQNGATQGAAFKSRSNANDWMQSNKRSSVAHLGNVAPFVSV